MRYGVTMFMTDQTMSPVDLARAIEERGLHSLYVPEHTHIPTSRLTPPPTGDAELRDEYKRTLDPFVALAMAAAVTERLIVGTGICLVAQRDPIVTAKAIATLDQQSGGRFVLGMGFGWNADEIADHGVTMPQRRDVTREHLLAMRALWQRRRRLVLPATTSTSRRRGRGPSPHEPVGRRCSSAGPRARSCSRHVAEYADGWIPIGGAGIRERARRPRPCVRGGRS